MTWVRMSGGSVSKLINVLVTKTFTNGTHFTNGNGYKDTSITTPLKCTGTKLHYKIVFYSPVTSTGSIYIVANVPNTTNRLIKEYATTKAGQYTYEGELDVSSLKNLDINIGVGMQNNTNSTQELTIQSLYID